MEGAAARRRALRTSLSPPEWTRIGGMTLVILALNLLGWGIFVLAILPHHFKYKGLGIGAGVALTAWTLGMRHAFDADHISAIDNVTRKLMAEGKRPLATGFFFAIGHSAIVFALGVGISVAARAFFGEVVDPSSSVASVGGIVETGLSGGFLYLIAALNLVVLIGIMRVFRDMRRGLFNEAELERQLQARGLMYRFFGRFMRSISHTWQMFFVGLVFGIGFDTATEILLLAATAAAATSGLPWYAVLALPLLFSGGMVLFDTLDGCFMNFAYGWAFARPVRKVFYNLVITGLSIAVAFLIGTIEIIGLLAAELHLHGRFWDFMANFDINKAGFIIAALFIVVWTMAIAVWKVGRVEQSWQAGQSGHRAHRGGPATLAADPADGAGP
jgi:high-affinity nickel-transport protein